MARSKRSVPLVDKTPGNPAALGKLGGEAASVCQRVEDNAFHLRAPSERVDRLLPWRAVASAEAAEDDAKTDAGGTRFTRISLSAG